MADVSACGPRGFTDTLTNLAEGLPEDCRLHLERFEPKPRSYLPNTAFTAWTANKLPVPRKPIDTLTPSIKVVVEGIVRDSRKVPELMELE